MSGTKPLRIGIIASARFPIREPFAGGLERHTHLLARYLRQRGHEVRVFASGDSDPDLGLEPVCDEATRLDLSPTARGDVSMLADSFMQEHHSYLRLMLRIADAPLDVVQNSSLHYLPVAMTETVRFPVVTTLHTPPTPWLESAVAARLSSANARFVAVSTRTAELWHPRVTVDEIILNGVDVRAWPFRRTADPETAVWVGRIVPEKGPHFAVQAAHAAGLRLVLAGPVGDERYFRDAVRPLLGEKDMYAGHLAHQELAELVGCAGVLLCTPCWEEPYGLVVAESLACGTPVAAFDKGAMAEILDERCGRLAPFGDVAGLAQAAKEALELDRRECRGRAEVHCSADVMVEQYERLYSALAVA